MLQNKQQKLKEKYFFNKIHFQENIIKIFHKQKKYQNQILSLNKKSKIYYYKNQKYIRI